MYEPLEEVMKGISGLFKCNGIRFHFLDPAFIIDIRLSYPGISKRR